MYTGLTVMSQRSTATKGRCFPALLVSISLAFLFSVNAHALSVSPMVKEIPTAGANSRFSYTVQNGDSYKVAVEARVVKLDLDANGMEMLTPADDEVLVFPPIASIDAGAAQVLQVQYVGDPAIAVSQTYRVLVETIPVPSSDGSQKIGVSAMFRTLLNVVPERSKAVLSVLSLAEGDDGQWNVQIENTGDRYARLSSTRWVLDSNEGKRFVLESNTVAASTRQNLVLPRSVRSIDFDVPKDVHLDESTSISIEVSP